MGDTSKPGPIEVIRMRSWWINCSECSRCVEDPAEMSGERIESGDGTAAWRPLCVGCAKKLGLED